MLFYTRILLTVQVTDPADSQEIFHSSFETNRHIYWLQILHHFNEFVYFSSYKAGNCVLQTLINGKCTYYACNKSFTITER